MVYLCDCALVCSNYAAHINENKGQGHHNDERDQERLLLLDIGRNGECNNRMYIEIRISTKNAFRRDRK